MAYDTELADRVRNYLLSHPQLEIQEKRMFGGLAFLINDKMCVNISGERLMCRFDPAMQEELSERAGYEQMIMRGKPVAGYCYVHPEGFTSLKDFHFWMQLCLDYNDEAKSSKD